MIDRSRVFALSVVCTYVLISILKQVSSSNAGESESESESESERVSESESESE